MWDGTIGGKRAGTSLYLRVDHVGDLVARFGFHAYEHPLQDLQQIAREMAQALDLIDPDFRGRIIIEQPSHRDPVDRTRSAGAHGSPET